MNARAINSGSTLARWERRFARALLVAVALAGAVLGGIAHAQITIRSANSAGHSAAPVPTFVNAGAVAAGTGAITPPLPANIAVDDILLLFLETSNQAISIANQSGGTWTAVLNSPQSTGTAAGADGTRLTVFWSRYNGTQTAPVTSDSGNHQLGRIIAVRGVMASGNPWDVTAGGIEAGNTDTSGSIPGATTTVANTLVVAAIATALPDSTTTTAFSGWTNAGLAAVTERTDDSTGSNNGGGLGIATGTRAAAGAYGATTVTTSASTAKAMMSIALRPATAALTINTPAGTAANDVLIASVGFRVGSPGQYSTDIDVTAPPGWTLVRRLDNLNSTGSGLAIYQRVAVAGEPASHTWFFSCQNVSGGDTCVTLGFNGAAGGIASFIGVDNGTPIDVENGVSTAVASANLDTPSITTTVGNTMLVTSHAIPNANTWQNPPPSGMTQAYQRTSAIIMLQASYALQAAAGATGTKRATDAGPDAPDLGNAHILALRPARVLNQSAYRIFDNADSTNIGSPLAAQNTAAALGSTGAAFRLRVLLHVGNSNLAISGQAFKLQFAARSGTCDTAFSGETYADVTAATLIAYNNNATPADGAAMTANAGDPTHGADTVVNQTYEELNNFTNSVAAINAGQDGKWDFALRDNGAAAGTSYCFRVVRDTGTVLETYTVIPEITTAAGVPTPGSFNAFETSTAGGAITGVIRTKVAGSAFSLDVVSISGGAQQAGFTDAVIVELLGNNTLSVSLDAQNCPTSFTLVQTVSPNPTITAGRSTVSFAAVANSWRDVRVRVRWPTASPTVTWCSTDNFAIRPNSLASFAVSDTDWQTAGTGRALTDVVFGAVTHKAGRPLSVRATAVNASAAATTNYTGAPTATLTTCAGASCTATFGALTLTTTFAAGQLTSDVATYDNVGSFALQLVDSNFASVDAADTTGDCTASGRYVCSATLNVGRFVPDHFAVALNTPVFAPACGSFSYIGQAFNYSTAPVITVTAQDFANNTTTLYNTAGSWWRITNASLTGKAYTAAVGTPDVSGLPGIDPVIASAGGGTGTLTFGSGTGILFTRTTPTAPASPYDADISLAINVIDADGVTLASNPARFGTATAGNGIAFSDGNALTTNDKQMRFGRLAMRNANGSQLVPLRVQVEAQYWSGAPMNAFIANTQDNCTTIAAANEAMGNYTANLSGSPTCETAVGGGGTLSSGRRTLQMAAPGSGNNGSVDLTVNLGAAASGSTCTAQGGAPGAATTANLPHLQGNWTGGAYNVNPSARASFGVFRGAEEVVFVRENF